VSQQWGIHVNRTFENTSHQQQQQQQKAAQMITVSSAFACNNEQKSPVVADKPTRRLRKVCTVYVIAVGL